MRTQDTETSIATALFGKVRRGILGLLYTHSDESYYLRQIARIVGVGQGAVHRELVNLSGAGLLIRSRRGNLVYYEANRNCPVFADLRGLIVRTAGVADVLRVALAPLADRITAALVYGSVARGAEKTDSDVDVMVIGDVDFGDIVSALRPAQDQLRREVNPSVFSSAEFRERIASKDHFITSVLREPKVILIGDENELGAVA